MATNYCSMQELNEKLEKIEQTSNQEISFKINFGVQSVQVSSDNPKTGPNIMTALSIYSVNHANVFCYFVQCMA